MHTSRLPPPLWRDSSRHCHVAPRRSSQSCSTAQFGRQMPPLREMQLNPSGQLSLVSQAGVQTPSGKLPPVMQRPPWQSAAVSQESPTLPESPHPTSTAQVTSRKNSPFISTSPRHTRIPSVLHEGKPRRQSSCESIDAAMSAELFPCQRNAKGGWRAQAAIDRPERDRYRSHVRCGRRRFSGGCCWKPCFFRLQ
jgi:hypothetical protein